MVVFDELSRVLTGGGRLRWETKRSYILYISYGMPGHQDSKILLTFFNKTTFDGCWVCVMGTTKISWQGISKVQACIKERYN